MILANPQASQRISRHFIYTPTCIIIQYIVKLVKHGFKIIGVYNARILDTVSVLNCLPNTNPILNLSFFYFYYILCNIRTTISI